MTARRIYVASSWRNDLQPLVVARLIDDGHFVYDFRNPPNRAGFGWEQLDMGPRPWSVTQYVAALQHPIAQAGFSADYGGMVWADTCVLLLPCGRSAHLEAGYMAGQGKRVIVVTRDGEEPELMALLCTAIVGIDGLLAAVRQ